MATAYLVSRHIRLQRALQAARRGGPPPVQIRRVRLCTRRTNLPLSGRARRDTARTALVHERFADPVGLRRDAARRDLGVVVAVEFARAARVKGGKIVFDLGLGERRGHVDDAQSVIAAEVLHLRDEGIG
eukprot:7387081-Prymnesium_polylepis.1